MKLNLLFPEIIPLKVYEIVPVLEDRALKLSRQQLKKIDLGIFHGKKRSFGKLEPVEFFLQDNYYRAVNNGLPQERGKLSKTFNTVFEAIRYAQLWKTTAPTQETVNAVMKELNIPENVATIIARQRNHVAQFLPNSDFKMGLNTSMGEFSRTFFEEWVRKKSLPVLAEGNEPAAVRALLPFFTSNCPTELTDLMWVPIDDVIMQSLGETEMRSLLKKVPKPEQNEFAKRYDFKVIYNIHTHSHTITRVPKHPNLFILTLYDNESNHVDAPALIQRTQAVVDTEHKIMVILQNAFGLLPNSQGGTRLMGAEIAQYPMCIPVNHQEQIPYTLISTLSDINDPKTRQLTFYA